MEFFCAWCAQFKQFYVRLDASCARLRRAVEEPPPSRSGKNFPKFIDNLNGAVSSMSDQVESLVAVTVRNVSLEDIFSHCMELYNQNEAGISALETQLANYGYTPGPQVYPESNSSSAEVPEPSAATPELNKTASLFLATSELSPAPVSVSEQYSDYDDDDDPIFEESFSLRDLGLSSATLEVLAADGNDADNDDDLEASSIKTPAAAEVAKEPTTRQPTWKRNGDHGKSAVANFSPTRTVDSNPPAACLGRDNEAACGLAQVSEEEFEKVPPFLKRCFPLQELNGTIVKLSSFLNAKGGRSGDRIDPSDLEPLNLGGRTKECLLLLVRLGRLTFDNGDSAAYRPVFDPQRTDT